MTSKHFTRDDFSSCNPSCDIERVSRKLLKMLDELRERCRFALILTRAYCPSESDGKQSCQAVDVRVDTSSQRYIVIKNAIELGFKRIGIGEHFVHLDITANRKYPNPCIWHYYNDYK